MWGANPTWGSPKIVAELAMLGIDVYYWTVCETVTIATIVEQ